ncbi:serine protease [Massilia sp. ST3]|uniref:S1 family peptidase n=1 Tax=Massilia sp. ST3 TaxID=2824903 RepID=UPI001B823DE3|nr:serine protease [Massilia sp. ST3]MBQ5948029.1 trypsin-like peptidase domain-containing protein [Massilia sp. ST3]
MKRVVIALLLSCIGLSAATAPSAPPAASRPANQVAQQAAGQAAQALPPAATPPAPDPGEVEALEPLPPPSSAAQDLYASARADLLQIRMLLKNGRTQSTVGSGFLVGTNNLAVTNYHVVSQMALDPDVYTAEYIDTDGNTGPVELMAVDVLHDLAVVRVNRNGSGFFKVPERPVKLSQGQYLYALGNPLDLGFAISEGSYNGVLQRSFYDRLIFSGPINSGMSGGPTITASGTVAGINVARRLDGESVSFLVPVKHAQELLRKVAAQPAPPRDFNPLIAQQLLVHQGGMVDRLLDEPLTLKGMGPYLVPVRESGQVRCWGRSTVKAAAAFSVDAMNCVMQSAVFVSDSQQTGSVAVSHRYIRSGSMEPLRFAALAGDLFGVEGFGNLGDPRLTKPFCTERFVHTRSLPLRAVTCVRGYRKFEGLYNFTLLTASTDAAQASLQSRVDVAGVSYENGLRVTQAFLGAFGRSGRR